MENTFQIQSETFYPNDIWTWSETLSDYPASSGYVLTLALRQGDLIEVISAEADGDSHKFTIQQSTTSKFLGKYTEWQYQISLSTTLLKTIGRGGIEIKPNLLAEKSDINYWQSIYDKAKVLYEALVDRKVTEVSINGRAIKYSQRAELTEIMSEAKNMIEKLSGTQIKKIKVRFQRT